QYHLTQIASHQVLEPNRLLPRAAELAERGAVSNRTLIADDAGQALELPGHLLVELDHVVQGVGDPPRHPRPIDGQAHGEVPLLECREGDEYPLLVEAAARGSGGGGSILPVGMKGQRASADVSLLRAPRSGCRRYVVWFHRASPDVRSHRARRGQAGSRRGTA